MPGLLGLRIFEATGADITDLGGEHTHRVLRVCGKGTKVVLVPLPPAVGRAIDRATGTRNSPDGDWVTGQVLSPTAAWYSGSDTIAAPRDAERPQLPTSTSSRRLDRGAATVQVRIGWAETTHRVGPHRSVTSRQPRSARAPVLGCAS
ncbi:MAG TPA: hypothetical protein VGS19_14830 [Streptosporangiaceae bacterium]|nr:hypothetical protein [Streptosporangiaceae bacterium]